MLTAAMLAAGDATAQTNNSYPMLLHLHPTAATLGQSTEHELSARYNLAGATAVLVSGAGVTAEILPDEKEKPEDRARTDVMASKRRLKFTVAADALPGVRDFRVITPHGASTVGQVVVVRDPVIAEAADNDSLAAAQPITLPAVVCGKMEKAEDRDLFKFSAAAGDQLTFHVQAQRLLNRIHDMQSRIDPLITLRTAAGVTLAASDNFYAGDPLLHHRFAEAGEYVVEVRDVRYQGNADWVYALEISARPFVTQAFPLAVAAGADRHVALRGFALADGSESVLKAPTVAKGVIQWLAPVVGETLINPVSVFVTPLPIVVEAGPPPASDAGVASSTDGGAKPMPSPATPASLPAVLAGCIERPYEVDRFEFEAKAQEKWSFEVIGRRAGSGIDSLIAVRNGQGGQLAEADDGTYFRVQSSDSLLESWTAPADGKYTVEIRDLHQRGGPEFTYAIQAARAEPHFLLEADTDKTLLAPGIHSVIYVRGLRKHGFAGPIPLNVEGLPPGVTAVCGTIQENSLDGCIVLHCAADAPAGAANIRITGSATHPIPNAEPLSLTAEAAVLQEYYSPGGGRGNYPVEAHCVSVADPMDVRSIQLSATELSLKPGGSQRIDVTVERAPNFKGNITLDAMLQHLEQPFGNCLPKGVKLDVGASKTLLTGDATTGHITLVAAPDAAPVSQHLISINVHVSINFVMKHTLCGPPVRITVEPK